MDNSSASPKMVRLKEFGAWSEQTSSSGKRYYYNRESEVSQWEKPAEWKEHEKSLAAKQGTTKQSKSSSSTATKPPTAQQQKPESTKTSTTAQHASSDLPISSTVHTIPTTMLNTTTVSSRHNTSSTTTKVPTSSSTPITSGPPQQSSQHSSQNRSGGGVKRPREEERRDQHHQHRSSQPQQHNTPTPTSGSKYGESGGSHPVPEKISRTSASYEHSGSRTSKGQEKVGSSTTAGGTPQSEHLRPQFTSMPQSLPTPRNTSSPYSTPKFSGTTYTTPTTAAIISSNNENQHLQQRSSFNAATTHSFTPMESTITVTESSFTPIRNTTAQMPPVSAPPPVPSRPQSSTPQPMDVAPAKNLGVVADRNSSAQRESEVPQVEKKEEGEEQGVEVPAFREERYMRFYKPELTAHRRNWTSEAYANEAKKYAERNSKQSVNLASIDNDINSVRSLLKTAEVRCLMLNQKLSFVREQISGLEARNHAI